MKRATVFFLAAIASAQGAYATDERAVERVMNLNRATQCGAQLRRSR